VLKVEEFELRKRVSGGIQRRKSCPLDGKVQR